jgi:hypothetical protein
MASDMIMLVGSAHAPKGMPMYAITRSLAVAGLMALAVALCGPAASVSAQRAKQAPTACTVEPRTPEAISALVAAATPVAEPADAVSDPETWAASPADLPHGEPADLRTVAEITAVAREYAGCLNAGDMPRLAALMTDRSIVEIADPDDVAGPFAMAGTPVPVSGEVPLEIAWVRVSEVRMLDDGRVGAVVIWGIPNNPRPRPSPQANFHIFERVGDRWLLDHEITGNVQDYGDVGSVPGDDPAATDTDAILARARQGFNEVDSALYAEPTMAGAKFSIEALVMVGFVGKDDYDGVGCEMFIFERGEHTSTVSAYCRAEESLNGRAAYLQVNVYGPRRGSEGPPIECKDVAPLAAMVAFSCTVDLPEAASYDTTTPADAS